MGRGRRRRRPGIQESKDYPLGVALGGRGGGGAGNRRGQVSPCRDRRGDTWRIYPQSILRSRMPCPGVATSHLPGEHTGAGSPSPPLRGAGWEVGPLGSGTPPLLVTDEPRPLSPPGGAPPPPPPPGHHSPLAQSGRPHVTERAPPAGSGPGPRARGRWGRPGRIRAAAPGVQGGPRRGRQRQVVGSGSGSIWAFPRGAAAAAEVGQAGAP